MIIKPMIRNNVCLTTHPKGCEKAVADQIEYVKRCPAIPEGPKRVLVIGGSTGYGLASRIVSAFGSKAATLNVSFEKEPSETKTGTPGFYNNRAFDKAATDAGLFAMSLNADAFSNETRAKVIQIIKEKMGAIDLLVYSIASPVRKDPKSDQVYRSVLKPIGRPFRENSVDFMTGELKEVSFDPATDQEVEDTIKVMGGEDWVLWVGALKDAGVLSEKFITVTYSYIGPVLTFPIYRDGTIGKAKENLEQAAHLLNKELKPLGGRAVVSVNKAVVTRASSVIPVVPLYISILFKALGKRNLNEGCIEQIQRLFAKNLYSADPEPLDEEGRIRIDDWEMRDDVQKEIAEAWNDLSPQNLSHYADLETYRREFYQLHGFAFPSIDYEADCKIL